MSILGFLRKFPSRIASEWGLSNPSRLVKVIFCLPLRFNVSWFGPQNARNAEMSWQWRPKELRTFSLTIGLMCILEKSGPDTVVTRIVLLVALTLPYLDSTFSLPDSILHLGMSKLAILFDFFSSLWSEAWPAPVHFFVLLFLILPFIEFNHPSQNVLIFNSFAIFLPLFSSCDFGVCSNFPFLLVSFLSLLPLLFACCACQQWCL